MPYPEFNLARLKFDADPQAPPAMTAADLIPLDASPDATDATIDALGAELVQARNQGGATVFLCDAAVFRAGTSLHLINLMEKGLLTHLAIEPAGVLCDWELAGVGRMASTAAAQLAGRERIDNLLATLAAGDDARLGVGEALGRGIHTGELPHHRQSVLAEASRLGVPVTVHTAIGGALLHAVGGFDPARVGRMLHRDFLVLANSLESLDDGVVCQFGRPTAAVSVFVTALAAARNVAAQYRREIVDFSAAVFSEKPGGDPFENTIAGAADRCHAVRCDFAQAIPALRSAALACAGWNAQKSPAPGNESAATRRRRK